MKLGLYALMFGSGAAGLIYEVAWSRALGIWLGHGERGAAATLTLFFLGLSLGYLIAARLLRRPLNALVAYALCELSIGVFALAISALRHFPTLEPALWPSLLLPTTAMGASFPFIMQALDENGLNEARGYALHLGGATLGTLLTTFFLIEHLGVFGSSHVAVVLSLGAAALAFALGRQGAHSAASPAQRAPGSLLFAAALAGFATLALEVLCLRLFALTFQNTTYTFGLTLATFVLYLALGSRRAARALASAATGARSFVATGAALASACTLLTVPLFGAVTRFGELRAPSFLAYTLLSLGLVAMVLALPVSAAGTLLPGLYRASLGGRGQSVGQLSAANSLGAAFGAAAATFVLLPKLGLFASFCAVAATYGLLSLSLSESNSRRVVTFAGLSLLGWLSFPQAPLPPPGYTLLARHEGPFGWVDLVREEAEQALSVRVDLHYRLGKSTDRIRHVTMGKVPLSLHPRPEQVMFIGLATGMTASAALDFPSLRKIEVVELIREVRPIAERFSSENRRVLDDPRLRLVFEDGRSHMRDERSLFDVIVCDLFVPSHSHTGYLYSVDHYQNVRRRLSKTGIFAQWLPVYMLGERELEWILSSVAKIFPHNTVWLIDGEHERALLGIFGHMQKPPATLSAEGARFVGRFRPLPGALLNTDERPRVEFHTPRTLGDRRLLVGERLDDYVRRRLTP